MSVGKVQKVGELSGQELRDHIETGHLVFDRRCVSCVMGQLRRRQHRRVKVQGHSLSVDISGPRQMARDCMRFMLVLAYKGEPVEESEDVEMGEGLGENN